MKTLIFIPTYNERENATKLYEMILAQKVDADILFIDDHSPDGTAASIEALIPADPRLHILKRAGKLGVGSAHFDGIQWAYDKGYERLISMDCDFTHPPEYLPKIIARAEGPKSFDVVVGSRYLQTKSLTEWNLYRKTLTVFGHFLTKTLLRMDYDATGGFRLYRLDRIPRRMFELVQSKGYSFFFESLFILNFNGLKIGEIPIVLPARTYGHSKMDISEIKKSVKLLIKTYWTTLFNAEKFQYAAAISQDLIDGTQSDTQGWDDYWENHKSSGGMLYDAIAAFYRKFIIRPSLNYFVTSTFKKDAKILHAGCGSGQVDEDIRKEVSITGLDISVNALNFYLKTNGKYCKVLHGSIFAIPLPAGSVEGIYNLGVMEHFTENEIKEILAEFHRVLKTNGRMVIFWPPEFGASVIFLKGVKWILENIFRKKNVKLHPDEITRVQSRSHVTGIFDQAGFKVLRYYFGLKDFFTYSVIVVERLG